jgi:adenosine deaminase
MRIVRIVTLVPLCLAACVVGSLIGASAAAAEPAQEMQAAAERTVQELERVRDNPLALRDFLKRMPKGADLHNHMHSAVYAETFIGEAVEDGLCVDPAKNAFDQPHQVTGDAPHCEPGKVPAATAYKDLRLYNGLIDAFSMRGFVPSEGETGHDHFFGAFKKFGGIDPSHTGAWLNEVVTRAAGQNEQYLELMIAPTWHRLDTITDGMTWSEDFAAMREQLLAKGLAEDIPAARAFFDEAEAEHKKRSKCGEADEAQACKVETRYIYEVFRSTPKPLLFAQALFGFELASADPRVVAINLVGEEDEHTSMTDYADHMRIVGYLRTLYPKVRVSLHAGELAPGLVPPEGLCCHIRLAVEEAKADRIGHGVDVMYEDRPYDLMKDMASKRVMVEINLTSNDVILGVEGKHHPFSLYRKFGVPVALATDDEGISRIDLTHEYVRAVETYGLSYADLKHMVRNSLEYSFLPGASLWTSSDYARLASACESDASAEKPSATCDAFLKGSEKAAQQWELEKRFRVFEAGF